MITGTQPRSVGHAIVEELVRLGVPRAYLVPGESFLDVLDGMHDRPLDAVVCRQEGGAGYMAMAEARLTGLPGCAMVTRGPGAANAMIAVHTAYQDATPLVLFIGLVPVSDRERDSFQEFDPKAWFGSTAKDVVVIDDPAQAPTLVRDAFHRARTGRPGPVVVGLPEDVLVAPCGAPVVGARALPAATPEVTNVLSALAAAERPAVVVGGDAFTDADAQALARFATEWDVPVLSDFRAYDKLDNLHESWCGGLGYGRVEASAGTLRDADLLLFLGCPRSDVLSDGYTIGMEATTALVDPDPDAVAHSGPVDFHLVCRPGEFLVAAATESPVGLPPWSAWTQKRRRAYVEERAVQPCRSVPSPELDLDTFFDTLGRELSPDAIITYGAGNHALWPQRFIPARRCPSVLGPRNGAMGFGVPAAVAAALAAPGRPVVTVAGDGCFLMNGQELATAASRGLDVLVIVVDNGQYGTIRQHQERHYPGRVSGTQLHNPDFVALVAAYGGEGCAPTTTDEALDAARRYLAEGGLKVIHLVVDQEAVAPRSA